MIHVGDSLDLHLGRHHLEEIVFHLCDCLVLISHELHLDQRQRLVVLVLLVLGMVLIDWRIQNLFGCVIFALLEKLVDLGPGLINGLLLNLCGL